MTRKALRPNPQKRQVSIGVTVPAPVGGWDAKSPISAMPPQNAVILDNWIPRAGYVELRRGYVPQVVGTPGWVESMMAFRGGAAGDKLFAASQGKLYDVTTAGALGAAVLSGLTNNRWNYTAFANGVGEWLIACNGADAPIGYNGGAWGAVPALSSAGVPVLVPTSLFNVFSHKGRLYYLQQNSLYVWSPAAGAVGGLCTLLDLSSIFTKGGRLICAGSWSWQFGVTADDFAVFMTDQGQLAIFEGSDPTNAANFSLAGIYDFGPPLGPKALLKYGGDLAVVTADGIIPLSQGLKLDRGQQPASALTSNILTAFSAAVKAYGANYGWQGVLYPGTSTSSETEAAGGSLAIFNIPTGTLASSMQFVQNVLTGAWCRFLNISAACWEIANGNVYFGGAAGVYQWDQGSSDNGVAIVGDVKPAFSALGQPGVNKQFKMIRALMNTVSLVQPALDVDVDYQESEPSAIPIVVGPTSVAQQIRLDWTGCGSIGYVAAPRMQVNLTGSATGSLLLADVSPGDTLAIDNAGDGLLLNNALPFDVPCQLYSFDLLYERGAIL